MCGRYSETADKKKVSERFKCKNIEGDFSPRRNIAPTQEAPVVVHSGERSLRTMRWGLVPSWSKEIGIGNKLINARAETLREKPSFRKAFEQRRCLVAADGFYEWQKVEGSKTKVPMRIVLKSRGLFAFAGLWDIWKKQDGSALQSFTIITTEPNGLVRPIHNRMPVILREEDEQLWLDPGFKEPAKLSKFLSPYPEREMEAYEVSLNTLGNDSTQSAVTAVQGRFEFQDG